MPLRQLNFATLHQFEGTKVSKRFDQLLKRAADDCYDRPKDMKAREIHLVIKLVPDPEENGTCERVKTQVQVKGKIPDYVTRFVDTALQENGLLAFNPDSPGNVNQGTLLDDPDED